LCICGGFNFSKLQRTVQQQPKTHTKKGRGEREQGEGGALNTNHKTKEHSQVASCIAVTVTDLKIPESREASSRRRAACGMARASKQGGIQASSKSKMRNVHCVDNIIIMPHSRGICKGKGNVQCGLLDSMGLFIFNLQ
jgi:hypothetical protein